MKNQLISCLALLACVSGTIAVAVGDGSPTWIDATNDKQVIRIGDWRKTSFRYAHASHLQTSNPGAALEVRFQGTGIAIRLGNNAVPAYGIPNLGRILVLIDGGQPKIIEPRSDALEVVLARSLTRGEHHLRVEHQPRKDGNGCRIEGFRVFDSPTGDLQFTLNGEDNVFLVEARVIVTNGNRVIRNTLV
jgi:hypothetical protein